MRLGSRMPMDGFCRYTSLLNLAVQGWDTAFVGEPHTPLCVFWAGRHGCGCCWGKHWADAGGYVHYCTSLHLCCMLQAPQSVKHLCIAIDNDGKSTFFYFAVKQLA